MSIKVRLNTQQLSFLIKMTELSDPAEAMKKFAELMTKEGVHPSEMSQVIDIIMQTYEKLP